MACSVSALLSSVLGSELVNRGAGDARHASCTYHHCVVILLSCSVLCHVCCLLCKQDDITFTSLPIGPEINTLPKGTYQCLFWGMVSSSVLTKHGAVSLLAFYGRVIMFCGCLWVVVQA